VIIVPPIGSNCDHCDYVFTNHDTIELERLPRLIARYDHNTLGFDMATYPLISACASGGAGEGGDGGGMILRYPPICKMT
jgi:hypothetical protein